MHEQCIWMCIECVDVRPYMQDNTKTCILSKSERIHCTRVKNFLDVPLGATNLGFELHLQLEELCWSPSSLLPCFGQIIKLPQECDFSCRSLAFGECGLHLLEQNRDENIVSFRWVNELKDSALQKNLDISGQEFCLGNSYLPGYISTRKCPWCASEAEPLNDGQN